MLEPQVVAECSARPDARHEGAFNTDAAEAVLLGRIRWCYSAAPLVGAGAPSVGLSLPKAQGMYTHSDKEPGPQWLSAGVK